MIHTQAPRGGANQVAMYGTISSSQLVTEFTSGYK